MPSAPRASASSTSTGSSMLAIMRTRWPSGVTAGRSRRCSSCRLTWICSCRQLLEAVLGLASGSTTTSPLSPSTATQLAAVAGRRHAPPRPTTAGTPIDRARIATWLVLPAFVEHEAQHIASADRRPCPWGSGRAPR